uniref:Uncharacterized protein n=1 Tax=Magnetospirillum gryphiswaldense TaxID=55518 RepID=A4TUT4_9PROT|nr:conserved hypothetical protein [Magnetospirillum gryphiswaldense MSR-1]
MKSSDSSSYPLSEDSPQLAGVIRRDLKVREAIRNQTPILTRSPNSEAAADVEAIVERLLRT